MTDRTAPERARRYRRRQRAGKIVIHPIVGADFWAAACWAGWITEDDLQDQKTLAEKIGRIIDYKLGTEGPDED